MSAFPDSEIHLQGIRRWELSRVQFAALATLLAVVWDYQRSGLQ